MVSPNNPESLENDLSLAFCTESESGGLGGEVCVLSISLWEIQKHIAMFRNSWSGFSQVGPWKELSTNSQG